MPLNLPFANRIVILEVAQSTLGHYSNDEAALRHRVGFMSRSNLMMKYSDSASCNGVAKGFESCLLPYPHCICTGKVCKLDERNATVIYKEAVQFFDENITPVEPYFP